MEEENIGGESVWGVMRLWECESESIVSAEPVLPCLERLGVRDGGDDEDDSDNGGRHTSQTRSFARDLVPLVEIFMTEARWVE